MTTLTAPRPIGTAQVDLGDPYHVYAWCRRWAVTEVQLRMAVRTVGSEARAVEAAINRARALPMILASETRFGEDRVAGGA